MNWGILTLLAILVCVLGGFAVFFVCLARKAAARESSTRRRAPELGVAASLPELKRAT
jgi:hypothetical protein